MSTCGGRAAEKVGGACTGGDAERIGRVLRFCAAYGVFDTEPSTRNTDNVKYRNNKISALLRCVHVLRRIVRPLCLSV